MCDAYAEEIDEGAGGVNGELTPGGYDCTFVDPVPDDMVCTICLSVLRDPHLLSCCGYKFCYRCIEPVMRSPAGSSCPHCRETDFATMLDKALQRQILNLSVYCSNKDTGCAWVGETRSLGGHIADKCIYTIVTCQNDNCTVTLQRWKMVTHEQDECEARPIERKVQRLVEKMEDRLMSLKKENDDQRDVIKKLQDQLNEQVEEQKHKNASFEERLEEERTRYCEAIDKLQMEQEELMERVKVEIKADKVGIVRQLDLLKNTVSEELLPAMHQVHKSNSNLTASMVDWPLPIWQMPPPLAYSAQFPPCQYIMSSFVGYKSSQSSWFSPPFYSWPGGYKLSLCLSAKGYSDGKTDYMSASVQLLEGEYDDMLLWPASCLVTVKLLNWRADRNHLEQVIPIQAKRCGSGVPSKTKNSSPDTAHKTVISSATMQRSGSFGDGQIVLKFASIPRLIHNPITQTEYLHHDYLCVRIEAVSAKDS